MIRSPFQALSMLHMFRKREVQLTQSAFDECFDCITFFLEKCNNERHRLVTLEGDDDEKEGS